LCDKETKAHFEEIKEILYQTRVDIAVINQKLDKNDNDHKDLKPLIKDHEQRLINEEKFSSNIRTGVKIVLTLLTFGLINFSGGVK
jgi:hypothetical protein